MCDAIQTRASHSCDERGVCTFRLLPETSKVISSHRFSPSLQPRLKVELPPLPSAPPVEPSFPLCLPMAHAEANLISPCSSLGVVPLPVLLSQAAASASADTPTGELRLLRHLLEDFLVPEGSMER
mmetsp:Transcript_18928/g.38231  ORF Transcript_18928/g.38231 Transcript_18928/m.38231 type:complete len:126 (-) Transcript_18928:266-643(-)